MHPESPCTPHFDAQYNPPPANVFLPARELIFMMSPPPCRIIDGITARETRKTLFRFVPRTRSQSSSLFSCAGPKSPMPALLTRIPTGPSFASVAETSFPTSSARVTSAVCQMTLLVSPRNSSAVACSLSMSRPQMATPAPSSASFIAIARPMPRLPPVTSAILFVRGPPISFASFVLLMPTITILLSSGRPFSCKTHLNIQPQGPLCVPYENAPGGLDNIKYLGPCRVTPCRFTCAFPIIPKFYETALYPATALQVYQTYEQAWSLSEENGMNRTRRMAGLAIIAALCLAISGASSALAQAPAGQDAGAGKQQYTMAEYNAYQAAAAERNPAQQIKLLDDFVAKYPNSALLIYIYPLYYNAYSQLKNWPKVTEYADKLLALGEKSEAPIRYQAYYARAFAYSNLPPTSQDVKDQAPKACEAAKAGLKTLGELKKPDNMSEDDFNKQKQQPAILFSYTLAQCSMIQKDYQTAIDSYKAVLEKNPDDAITSYKIGQAYMAMNPPQQMDAFWYFAKAASAKNANQTQATQVKSYLRKLIANYQGGNVCDNLVDAELNELLQLASTSAERPASYKLISTADLDAARKDMTIASVIADLKAGGDKAKITWLAACGLEFPDVPGKLIGVTPGSDAVQLKVAFVTSDAEFDAKTTPDMDVKVVGQPEAAKLEKDNPVRFTGTLAAYDPDPAFMLHWDKAKVNAEDIPKEKEKKSPTKKRPVTKKPGRG